jgi:hypothetical protein
MANIAPTGMVTAKDIAERIEKKSGVSVTVRLQRASWFPRRSSMEVAPLLASASEADRKELLASLNPTVMVPGKDCPLSPARKVFEIFEDDSEFRVYTLSAELPPARYKLSKTAPLYSLAEMTMDTFINEIADEWSVVEAGMSTAQAEREKIVEYGESMEEGYSLDEFLSDIKEEVHLQEDDDEEEPESAPIPPQEAPAAAPATMTPTT